MEKEGANKLDFLNGGLLKFMKKQWKVDVWLKAGDHTDAIPAHKLILGSRSKVFKYILETNDSSNETITLSEMTRSELEAFLEFMYDGSLSSTTLKQHVRALYLAADKYEIPYLQDLCRKHLIYYMNSSNAFDFLELAEIHSDKILKQAISKFFASHMDDISFSSKFLPFVRSNPDFTVQIVRDYVNKMNNCARRRRD